LNKQIANDQKATPGITKYLARCKARKAESVTSHHCMKINGGSYSDCTEPRTGSFLSRAIRDEDEDNQSPLKRSSSSIVESLPKRIIELPEGIIPRDVR
jgi:hypothetical protein